MFSRFAPFLALRVAEMSIDVPFDAERDAPLTMAAADVRAVDDLVDYAFSAASMSLLSSLRSSAILLGRNRDFSRIRVAVGVGVCYYFVKPNSTDALVAVMHPKAVTSRSADVVYRGSPLALPAQHAYWYFHAPIVHSCSRCFIATFAFDLTRIYLACPSF